MHTYIQEFVTRPNWATFLLVRDNPVGVCRCASQTIAPLSLR